MNFPKFQYTRSKPFLKLVAALPCQRCGSGSGSQASHSNKGRHGKGLGIKASDQFIAALCPPCHTEIDSGKNLSEEEKEMQWMDAHRKTVRTLLSGGNWPANVPVPDIRVMN